MTRAQQQYMQRQRQAMNARQPVEGGAGKPGLGPRNPPAPRGAVGDGRTPTPPPAGGGGGGTPPAVKDPNSQFTGQVIPNPNTGTKGTGADTSPWSGVWNDPVNGPGATKTIPLDSTGKPRWSVPVGGPYQEQGESKHVAGTPYTPFDDEMIAAGFDPSNAAHRYAFASRYDPKYGGGGVTRNAAKAGLDVDRRNIADLNNDAQNRFVDEQSRTDWQNRTVDSANIGANREAYGTGGIGYRDPSIPPLDDPDYWRNRAFERQTNWANQGGIGGPGPYPLPGPGEQTEGKIVKQGGQPGMYPNPPGFSEPQANPFSAPVPPAAAPAGVAPVPGAVMNTGGVLPPGAARQPLNPFAAQRQRQRGGVVYG